MCGGDDGRLSAPDGGSARVHRGNGRARASVAVLPRDVRGQISVRACSRCMMVLRIPRSSLSDSQTASWSCDAGWSWARARGLAHMSKKLVSPSDVFCIPSMHKVYNNNNNAWADTIPFGFVIKYSYR